MKKIIIITTIIIGLMAISIGVIFYFFHRNQGNVCEYNWDGVKIEAYCNQLKIGYDYGYTTQDTKDKVTSLVEQYNGKITQKILDGTLWRVELRNDKKIYELKEKIKSLDPEHIDVFFNMLSSPQSSSQYSK